MTEIGLTLGQAQKVVELLEGWSLVLTSSFPQRLFDLLVEQMSETGVYEPLRYDMPIGPSEVAVAANEIVRDLRESLQGAGFPIEGVRMTDQSWEQGLTIGDDIARLAQAVSSCIESIQEQADGRPLKQEMRQELEAQWNQLADIERRYKRDLS